MADVSSIPLPFSDVHIPIIFYVVLVFIGLIFVAGIFGYVLYDWNLGKPLRILFTTRIERWKNNKLALFEILSLSNNLRFEKCEGSREGGYSRISRTITKRIINKKSLVIGFVAATLIFIITIISAIWLNNMPYSVIGLIAYIIPMWIYIKRPTITEVIGDNGRKISYIIPKSIYSVNSVDVVPLLDLHPSLPDRIERGLQACINSGIKTLVDLSAKAEATPNDILYGDVTFEVFRALYVSYKNKYNINIKVSDILNFISSNVDENAGESLELKDYNEVSHKKQTDRYIKYLYIGILLMCLAFFIKIIYRLFHPAA